MSSGILEIDLIALSIVLETGERLVVFLPTTYFLPALIQALGNPPESVRFLAASIATVRSSSEISNSFISNLMRSGTTSSTAPFFKSTNAR